eukprot:scaffold211833_cov19-Tisochrysis_lutea.AAC.1
MADLECVAQVCSCNLTKQAACVGVSHGTALSPTITLLQLVCCSVVSQEKFKDEAKEAQHMWHEAMRCLCIQYPLAQHGKDVAFSFENFFEDSIDSLGRALWEFLQVILPQTYMQQNNS